MKVVFSVVFAMREIMIAGMLVVFMLIIAAHIWLTIKRMRAARWTVFGDPKIFVPWIEKFGWWVFLVFLTAAEVAGVVALILVSR